MELTILVICGAIVMAFAILKTQKLIKSKYLHEFGKAWVTLKYFMIIFLVGYLIILFFVFQGRLEIINSLTGTIFLLGALFVYITVNTGYGTIRELYYTTVSKDYVDKIVDSMADTLIVLKVGADLNITKVNRAILNLLDYEKDEVIGKPLTTILHSNAKVQHFLSKCKTGAWLTNKEAAYFTKDGDQIPVLLSISCICDSNDEMQEMIIAGKDITELKKAREAIIASERRLKKLNKQLNESNIMKELLLDVITHDLKNPASIIRGFSEIALDADPNNEILQEISNGTDSLFSIIDSAYVMSKIATGDKIKMIETDVSKIIKNIEHEFSPHMKSAQMELINNVPDGIILTVNPIIAEVFRNYISNAIKYAQPGKKIELDADITKDKVNFRVVDYGKTIPKKDRNIIFKRTKQLDNTAGEGLGLAIVDRIAIAHKAKVGVNPNKKKGNTFYIEIPK